MKVYTDVAQLPLAASIRQLPAFSTKRDDTQRDTQTLVPDSPVVSPLVLGLETIKVEETTGNIDENHSESFLVTAGHENGNGGVF
jgi:hypothetical protein